MTDAARPAQSQFDVVLVGGGLQNGLIALRALHTAAPVRIAIIEAEQRLGGNHTWCVHARDVPQESRAWFEPLVVCRWPDYDVRFPGLARTLHSSYSVVSSDRFASVVSIAIARSAGSALFTGRRALRVSADAVELDDGRILSGKLVVDARGPDPASVGSATGFQKFVGRELRMERAHGLQRPLLMDALCAQEGGFRFFYVLPLAADRLLVEETRFSRSAALDMAQGRAAVDRYAAQFGRVLECVREESGVLPMPWSGALPAQRAGSALAAGYRGGYFHPATGYSLPAALRLAEIIGAEPTQPPTGQRWQEFQRRHRAQVVYAQQLNRLLFSAFADVDMWRVFARFYRLREDLIERFYAMSLSVPDRARVLLGRPPSGFSLSRMLFAGAAS
jgi:lycopene beta-cyclase